MAYYSIIGADDARIENTLKVVIYKRHRSLA